MTKSPFYIETGDTSVEDWVADDPARRDDGDGWPPQPCVPSRTDKISDFAMRHAGNLMDNDVKAHISCAVWLILVAVVAMVAFITIAGGRLFPTF